MRVHINNYLNNYNYTGFRGSDNMPVIQKTPKGSYTISIPKAKAIAIAMNWKKGMTLDFILGKEE